MPVTVLATLLLAMPPTIDGALDPPAATGPRELPATATAPLRDAPPRGPVAGLQEIPLPSRPFPADMDPEQARSWLDAARRQVGAHIYQAMHDGDADQVARLLVLLGDARAHVRWLTRAGAGPVP